MPRQLDDAGSALLKRSIEALGVHVHVGKRTTAVLGDERVEALELDGGERLDVDMVVISAGIVARDELARDAGLARGRARRRGRRRRAPHHRPRIFAIGEVALHGGMIYGLVAPGYEMADVLARNLAAEIAPEGPAGGERATFAGADTLDQAQADGRRRRELRRSVRRRGDRSNRSPSRTRSPAFTRSCSVSQDGTRCSAASWSATPATTAHCVLLVEAGEPSAGVAGAADSGAR